MTAFLSSADDLLRGRRPAAGGLRGLAATVVGCGMLYGAVMGAYGGLGRGHSAQVALSAAKVPVLLLATLGLSLPSFAVLSTLLGVRDDLGAAIRGIMASQAALTIVLASLAPLTAFWYASAGSYHAAILFNAAMFGLASLGGQVVLRRAWRPLIARNPRQRWILRAWLIVYGFVGVQMGWVLRPFVGDPTGPVQLFRADSWGNAYIIVARMVWEQVGGS